MKTFLKIVLMVSAWSPLAHGASHPSIFAPSPEEYAHDPLWRYTGCEGNLAFSRESYIVRDPVRSCEITLDERICRISIETCCMRQCYFFYTGDLANSDAVSETDQMRRNLIQKIQAKVAGPSSDDTTQGAERPADLTYYYQCIRSCLHN